MNQQLELFPEFSLAAPAHSKIGASSMSRWSKCPGSVRLSKDIPSVSSPYAEEGTRAHELAADILVGKPVPPNVDEEMMEAVNVYVDYVLSVSHLQKLWVEHRFDLSSLYAGLFGTADAVIYNEKTKTFSVIDYKHGMGLPVEVENNPQLMYYALGALMSFNLPVENVDIVVVQPRCPHSDGPIRKQSIHPIDLMDFGTDLVAYAKATEDENAPIVPGSHCKFCPAAGVCPSIHQKAIVLAKEEFSPALAYDPKKLSEALNWAPTLKDWANKVMEFAYNEANQGRVPPGWKLVEKRATRKWKDEAQAQDLLQHHFGLDQNQIFKKSLNSVAQIEKVLPKSARDEIAKLVVSESSGTTLVNDSDKRPARSSAQIDFEAVPLN